MDWRDEIEEGRELGEDRRGGFDENLMEIEGFLGKFWGNLGVNLRLA